MSATERMQPLNDPSEVPEFRNKQEEDEFWAIHEITEEFLARGGPVPEGELPPPRSRTRPISLRLDEDVLRRLRAVAETKHKGYQTLLKEFVVERLYEEEKREGLLPKPSLKYQDRRADSSVEANHARDNGIGVENSAHHS